MTLESFNIKHRKNPSLVLFERSKALLNSDHWEGCVTNVIAKFPEIDSFLEIGCGGGMLPTAFSKRGVFATGFDVLDEAISWGKKNGQKVEFGVAWNLPVTYKFYLSYSHHVLEHIPSDYTEATLHEMDRVTSKYITMVLPVAKEEDELFVDSSQEANRLKRGGGHFINQTRLWWEDKFNVCLPDWEFFEMEKIVAPWETIETHHNFFLRRK